MNKKVIIGIAAGVAVAAAVGVLFAAKKKKSKKQILLDKADDLSDSFRSKLHSLQKKAQKEFKQAVESGEGYANIAKDRANELAKKTSNSFQ